MNVSNPGSVRSMVYNEVNVYNAAGVATWSDLDLSAVVGAKLTLVTLKAMSPSNTIAFRTKGDTDEHYQLLSAAGKGTCLSDLTNNIWTELTLWTDSSGVVQVRMEDTDNYTIDVIGYIN